MSETTVGPDRDATLSALVSAMLAAMGIGAWLRRRRAQRARLAFTVWDLKERYGAAAYPIALSSARQARGRETRRFWLRAASRLRRFHQSEANGLARSETHSA